MTTTTPLLDVRQYTHDLLPGDGRWTCTACPVQAEGHLPDGHMWYFRARHGEWTFQVSDGPTDDVQDAVGGEVLLHGDDSWDGFMPAKEAAALIRRCLSQRQGPFASATGSDPIEEAR
jgi:hypothetical protein